MAAQQQGKKNQQQQAQSPGGNLPARHREGLTAPLRSLQWNIDRLFDDFFGADLPFSNEESAWAFSPTAEIEEADDQYRICMDVPGIPKKNIQVEVRGGNLVVSGERSDERREKERGRRFTERSYGSFCRTFPLPNDVKQDQIKADFHDGVLEIALPKTEVTRAKTIPINEGKASGA